MSGSAASACPAALYAAIPFTVTDACVLCKEHCDQEQQQTVPGLLGHQVKDAMPQGIKNSKHTIVSSLQASVCSSAKVH